MLKKNLIIILLILTVVSCGKKYNPEITVDELKSNIEYLASDSLKGRKAGEAGDLLSAEFIRSKFENAGLELLYDNGFQKFGLVTSAEVSEGNTFSVNGISYEVENDFLPYAFSANGEVEAHLVIAGYGMEIDKDSLKKLY